MIAMMRRLAIATIAAAAMLGAGCTKQESAPEGGAITPIAAEAGAVVVASWHG
jgi:hypothetical protein